MEEFLVSKIKYKSIEWQGFWKYNCILPIFEKFHGGFVHKTLQIGEIPDPLRHLIQCLKFYILLQTIGLKFGVDGRGGWGWGVDLDNYLDKKIIRHIVYILSVFT